MTSPFLKKHAPGKAIRALATLGMPALIAALSACATAHQPPPLGTQAPNSTDTLILLSRQANPGSSIVVADFEAQQVLTGNSATVPKPAQARVPESQVSASRSDKDSPGDALTLQWKDAWYAALRLESTNAVDLRPFLAQGTLNFDLRVDDMAQGGLAFKINCGTDCERKLPYLVPARALAGTGWHAMAFAMSCFFREGDDFSAVKQPFSLDGSGTGKVSVANVRFVKQGQPNATCPDYRTESVTPSMLNQSWAINWWLPRHRKKLAEIQQLSQASQHTEVIFIGDSITQGWENEGRAVWAQHYEQYHALNLGFGGDHTENVLWRLQHGELGGIHPRVAVLMIGTNNTGDRYEDPRTTAAGVQRIVEEIRARLPDTQILLLAVFPRGEKPEDPTRRLNARVNALIAGLGYSDKVHFLNINDVLMHPDGTVTKDVMPDLLHLSEKGYDLWASAMNPTLLKLLSKP
ncbi:GDSL-type esterase/lipase family protein [Roseateles koreensis]|uniref:Glycoside hydrolase n=1 Tax=Roseateles koreensis TaxID=2987526 RepID=A0ABT5KW79_9BURK|nr:GDSL-type esterase/lipase family protein [Roseateles koreensis]MDC8787062.1 putative glycoside hydrolase [Roseateles koreensis]